MKAVTSSGTKLVINDSAEIHRGGEGRIVLLKEMPHHVAKIYLPNKTPIAQNQLKALQVLDSNFFVKPEELIFDAQHTQVIGFTMQYLGNDFIQLAAWFNQQFCKKNQIDFKRKLQLIKNLAVAIQQAHQANIVIGDLSGLNILVNSQDEIKFIDVDSYETPAQPHSGILLDEIRDYYLQGTVSKATDAFAFAVVAFNLLTYTHPFKGIHQIYKNLNERMMQLLPVFKADKNLIVPKCYEPIPLAPLQQQFEEIFAQGKRFLLSLSFSTGLTPQPVAVFPTTIPQGELTVKSIYTSDNQCIVKEVFALKNRLLVKTTQGYVVYDTSNYGYTTLVHEINSYTDGDVFIGHHHILARKGTILYVYNNQKQWEAIQNFSFSLNSRYVQIQDILIVIEDEVMKMLYLDQINQNIIHFQQTPVFGQGMHIQQQTILQQAGGKQYVFYHSGKNISSVQLPYIAHQVFITENQGVLSYKVQGGQETALKHEFFSLQDLKYKAQGTVHQLKHFAIKPIQAQQGIVFEPMDNELIIRRTEDYAVLQKLHCDLLSEQTQLFNTQAGIVAMEKNGVWLLNKR
jgi:serine/threonine protein kinase